MNRRQFLTACFVAPLVPRLASAIDVSQIRGRVLVVGGTYAVTYYKRDYSTAAGKEICIALPDGTRLDGHVQSVEFFV